MEFTVFFYLFSILYLSYMVYTFMNFLVFFNRERNYSLIDQQYEQRFYIIFMIFSLTTVSLYFFKEAYLIASYGRPGLPTILDAAYSIIFRSCILFLIGAATPLREEILSFIPEDGDFWLWMRDKIKKIYYPILIVILGIIIVSDPYIGGYAKLVSYILWGIVGTIVLIAALTWLQNRLRKIIYSIFFETEDESIRTERFTYAKTMYGISVITMYVAFIFLAIYLIAQVWGRPIAFDNITSLLDFKIFSTRGEGNLYVPFTVGSFFTVIGFIIGGIVISWLFEHFILNKTFHLLLVDVGVQNTIASISSYIIFAVSIIMGLMHVGVSGTTMSYFVGAIAVALAFAIKGPANDFIGYFILLVERSLKIGDYIEINTPGQAPVTGFVRKITPRTVVLRRNNSYTTIIPNAAVINSSFYNWNYTNTFFAFDDIILTVTYDSDPQKVREHLLYVLDKHKDVLKSPVPIVRLESFDPSGFQFLIRGFLSSINVARKWDITSDVRLAIVKTLRENNITIAIPIRYIVNKPVISTNNDA